MKKFFRRSGIRIISVIVIASAIAFVFLAPKYFVNEIGVDRLHDEFLPKVEPTVGIIEVWHVVGFKPFIGSLGSWLKKRADEFRKRYINVYINVRSMSQDEAELEIKRGATPDIISFSDGSDPGIQVMSSYPYCASGFLLLYDPNKTERPEAESTGSILDFKKGKAPSCACDIGESGALYRAQLMGECPYFEGVPDSEKGFSYQNIGIVGGSSEKKLPYAEQFIEYILSDEAQDGLCELGLLPVSESVEAEYDFDWLNALYDEYKVAKRRSV